MKNFVLLKTLLSMLALAAVTTAHAQTPQTISISTPASGYKDTNYTFTMTGTQTGSVWSVDPDGIEVSQNSYSKTYKWTTTGTKTITGYAPASGSYAQSNTYSTTIVINPPQAQTITISPSSWTMYQGQTKVFSATGSQTGYQWSGTFSSTNNNLATFTAPPTGSSSGDQTFSLTATAPAQGSRYAQGSATVTVTVKPPVAQTVALSSSDITKYVGQTAAAITASGGQSYVWSGTTSVNGGGNIGYVSTAAPGDYPITVYAPAQNPSSGTVYARSADVPAVVKIFPSLGNPNATTGTSGANVQAANSKKHEQDTPTAGDPIQIATGADALTKTLFRFEGARNWAFDLEYNSVLASVQATTGIFGYGWTHPFESKIVTSGSNLLVYRDAYHFNTYYPAPGSATNYICAEGDTRYSSLVTQVGGGWILTQPDQSKRVYDSAGKLIEDYDSHGRKLTLTYSGSQLSSIQEPVSGTSVAFTYASGVVSTITDAMAETVGISYSGSIIAQITNQVGKNTGFTYDAGRRMLTLTDHNNVALTTNTYDASGRAITQQDPISGNGTLSFSYSQSSATSPITTNVTDKTGAVSQFQFSPKYDLLSVTDPLSRTTTYVYDAYRNLKSATNALGHTTSYTYDSKGNILTITEPAGETTTFTYDAKNNLLTSVDALGATETRTYDSNNNLLTFTDRAGRTTTFSYNSDSLPLTITRPGSSITTYAYTNGRQSQMTDPNGVVTNFTYDANGRLLTSKDSANNGMTYTYDAVGNRLTETNALSQTTTFVYDHRNRLTSVTDPTSAVTSFTYDHSSNLTSVTNALGQATQMTYDGEGRRLTVTNPANQTTTYAYNAAGKLTSITDPTGAQQQFGYDADYRITSTTDPLTHVSQFTYDSRGKVLTETDPLNRTNTFTYDDTGRWITHTNQLSQQTTFTLDASGTLTSVAAPGGLTTSFGLDTKGLPSTHVNAANKTTSFTRNAGSQITAITSPNSRVTGFSYNSLGQLITRTAPNSSTTAYAYDAAGQVATTTDAIGTATVTRDQAGRVLTITENAKTLTRTYDALGRVTSFTDGANNTIGYTYDTAGNLNTLTYPDGKTVTYTYDGAHRLLTVTDWASRTTNYTYDANGRLTLMTRPNGSSQERTYDEAGQLASLEEIAPNGVTVIYSSLHTYDALGRVLTDQFSSELPLPPAGTVTQAFNNDNQMTALNGATTTFDTNGNLLTAGGSSFTYNARNLLTASGGLTYTYDAEGNRVGVGSTTFVVDPHAELSQVLVRTQSGGTITRYVYGLGLLYEDTAGSPTYYHYSRRGDTVALSNSSGTVTDRTDYGIYGEVLSRTGTNDTPFWFNGHYGVQTDANGLYYHRARYYSPALKRFLNEDPIGFAGGDNFYAYAEGDPVSNVDPSGYMTTIRTKQGGVYHVRTAKDFVETIRKLPRQSIKMISIYGHADSNGQFLDMGTQDGVFRDSKGGVNVGGGTDGLSESLGDILPDKMVPGGEIHLGGCYTALEKTKDHPTDENVARAVSRVVPNVKVRGSSEKTYPVPYTFEPGRVYHSLIKPFTTNIYLNGKRL